MKRILLIMTAIALVWSTGYGQTREKRSDEGFDWIIVKGADGKIGAETPGGKTIFPVEYKQIYFSGGYFDVLNSKGRGIYSKEGVCVIPPERGYSFISFHKRNDGNWFSVKKGEYKGACDAQGREIISPNRGYTNVVRLAENGKAWYKVEKGENIGACDTQGNEIVAPKYKSLVYSSGIYKTKDSGVWANIQENKPAAATMAQTATKTEKSRNSSTTNGTSAGRNVASKGTAKSQASSVPAQKASSSTSRSSSLGRRIAAKGATATQKSSTAQRSTASTSQNKSASSGNNRVKKLNETDFLSNEPQKIECFFCKGNGVCTVCWGTGSYYNRAVNMYYPCTSCGGSGKCSFCSGKGYQITQFANGGVYVEGKYMSAAEAQARKEVERESRGGSRSGSGSGSSTCSVCGGKKVQSSPLYINDPAGAGTHAVGDIGYQHTDGSKCVYCGKYAYHIHLKCYKCGYR